MNGTDAPEYFHKGVIKACVMEKPREDALLEYARFNLCPRCSAPRLLALGELKTERGPIGILVCLECDSASTSRAPRPTPADPPSSERVIFLIGWDSTVQTAQAIQNTRTTLVPATSSNSRT